MRIHLRHCTTNRAESWREAQTRWYAPPTFQANLHYLCLPNQPARHVSLAACPRLALSHSSQVRASMSHGAAAPVAATAAHATWTTQKSCQFPDPVLGPSLGYDSSLLCCWQWGLSPWESILLTPATASRSAFLWARLPFSCGCPRSSMSGTSGSWDVPSLCLQPPGH